MHYVRKGNNSREFEAVRWDGGAWSEMPDWLATALTRDVSEPGAIMRLGSRRLAVNTATSQVHIDPFDFVILGHDGLPFPCSAPVFFELYEELPTALPPPNVPLAHHDERS